MRLDNLLSLLTFFSIASASVIPIRRIRVPSDLRRSPAEEHVLEQRHARLFHKRQDSSTDSPISIILTPASEAPTDTPVTNIILTAASETSSITLFSATPAVPSDASATTLGSFTLPGSVVAVTPTLGSFTLPGSVITMTPTSTISSAEDPTATPSDLTDSQPASSTSASGPQPTVIPAGPRKYVVAHHMVGNTFPYVLQDWIDDINLAHSSGIDGFALNMGIDVWQPARVADAYEAAKQSNLDFKLFLSLDMSSFPCASPNDAQNIRNIVNTFVSHPNQLQYDSKAVVSTFAGESCTFGQGSAANGWRTQFTQSPDLQGKITFLPSFFIDPATFKDFDGVMDGSFNFNGGWPIQVTTGFAQNIAASQPANAAAEKSLLGVVTGAPASALTDSLEGDLQSSLASVLSKLQLSVSKFIGATDTDVQQRAGLAALSGQVQARDGESSKKAYMTAVSPWFFTHYGPSSFNKNFVFLADQHLYAKRWDALIGSRDQIDIVEIVTWNDYGESHYVGPIKGSQPNSQAWTDGMDHTAWLELTQYYATAFKTGQYPTIEKDKIIMWSRPHSNKAQTSDSVPQPTNFEILEDAVWAIVMTTAPSTVVLTTSPTTSMTFQVPAGVSKLAIPITPGGTMQGIIQRGGQTIVELNPTNFTFQGSPKAYNFNAFVASATAP